MRADLTLDDVQRPLSGLAVVPKKEGHARWKYIPAIDGLRALAILVVVASHFGGERFVPGGFGVTLFFFISGYLITTLLIQEHDETGTVSIGKFYVRRFLRLGPALIAMIAGVSIVYAMVIGPISVGQTFAALFYVVNYYSILGGYSPEPLGVLWSLSVEEHYYLLYPLFFSLFWTYRKGFFGVLVGLCVAVLLWRIYLVDVLHVGESRTYYATDTRIDSIIYGAILACMLGIRPQLGKFLANPWVVGLALVLLLLGFLNRDPAFRETWRYTVQGMALVPIFYVIVIDRRYNLISRLFELTPMILIGRWSYSLYLWHFPILFFVTREFGATPLGYGVGLLALFAFALISYYFIEQRFLGLRSKFR